MADKKPDSPSIAQSAQLPAVALCRDAYAGTTRMRDQAVKYLPRFPMESEAGYATRRSLAVFYNGFARTVAGLTGMCFRKDPKLGDDVLGPIKEAWEDIDNAGTHGDVFIADRLSDALVDGHVCIFVDMPVKPEGVETLDQDRALDLRPYWIVIKKSDVVRWSSSRIGGRQVLQSFAYKETLTEKDGEYGEKTYCQVREYFLENGSVRYKVMREGPTPHEAWVPVSSGVMDITEIPLSVVYAQRTGVLESKPPLEDLAHENVGHFQVLSDFRNTLHMCGVPFLIFVGADVEKIKIAPDAALCLPEGGTAEYVEPSGAGLEVTRQELIATEGRMAAQGLAMLQRDTRAAETAEAKRMEKSSTDSALARVVRSLSDGVEQALRHHAMWLGKDDAGGSVEMNRDFEGIILDPATVAEYRNLVAENRLSVQTLWDVLEHGGWLTNTFDRELEQDRLDQTAMKNEPKELPKKDDEEEPTIPPKPGEEE